MNISNRTCHRCNSDEGFTVLLNSNGNCCTCNGTGHLSEEHDTLFNLGFVEEVNLATEYSMYLQKVLNKLETITVKVKRKGEEFYIAKMDFNGPNTHEYMDRIQSFGDLIEFLKLKAIRNVSE